MTTGTDAVVTLPDGRTAQLWEGGAADGSPVLFLHGCPDTRHAAFSGDDAARRAGVHLVAVNRPGYGRSTAAASGQASVADDTVAVADLLGIGRFAVLGMSVGGQYALACAARHPERVTAAGVVAAPAVVPELDPPYHRDDLGPEQQELLARLATLDADAAAATVRPEFAAYVVQLVPDDRDDAALVARFSRGLPAPDAALLAARPVAEVAASVREALVQLDGYLRDAAAAFRPWEVRPEQVQCPTWLWYGEHDAQASVRNGQWLAERVPHATLTVRPTTHLATLLAHWDDVLGTLQDGT